jgi:mRNA interferase RelE/StbE
MKYEIILSPESVDDLKRLTAHTRAKVKDLLELHLRHEPTKVSKSRIKKKLRGLRRPQYRLRIDDIRVFYDSDNNKVEILAIISKSEAARWLQRRGEKL